MKPEPQGSYFFKHCKHLTGDSPDGETRPGQTTHPSIRRIDYTYAFNSGERTDNIGGPMTGGRYKVDGISHDRPTDAELKASVDQFGEHSYSWHCGYELFAANELPLPKSIAKMEPTYQTFYGGKAWNSANSYYCKITKWNARSIRTIDFVNNLVHYASFIDEGTGTGTASSAPSKASSKKSNQKKK
ncbi:MAG: hypothetical protein LBD14_05595 [Puniceicoccales bacterium]|nr:hypothetical protein [Puniceicoccales bacterium]